jgi:hypothetical protein
MEAIFPIKDAPSAIVITRGSTQGDQQDHANTNPTNGETLIIIGT